MNPPPDSVSLYSSPNQAWYQRVRLWAGKVRLARHFALALALCAVASAIATYTAVTQSSSPFGPDPKTVLALILTNLLLLIALLAVVTRRIIRLWAALRQGSVGSRLQTRIMAMFSLVTIIPATIVAIFSALFFNFGIQSWFDERVSTGLEESVAVAEAYLTEHKEVLRADAILTARDLNREIFSGIHNPAEFGQILSTQAFLRSLTDVVVFHGNRVLARTNLSFSMAFESLPQDALQRATTGEVVLLTDDPDKVRALIRLDPENTFLVVGRLVDSKVIGHMEKAQGAVSEYNRLKGQISTLQIQFSVVFVLVTLLLLLAAIWYGMVFSSRLMVPITRLIAAAERVRAGDFSTHVETSLEEDEIGTLGRAFNRMTGQLELQRKELVAANRQLDERRRFTEAVLAGVSAGVIAMDSNQRITLHNRSAVNLLQLPAEETLEGKSCRDIIPEIGALLEAAQAAPDTLAQSDIILTRHGKTLTLQVKITVERYGDAIEGFIVTFDDITELVAAQRSAAWADVARRVAHEIKNPLTPIHLAAERLKKKYLPQITADKENYTKYTDTIAKHVKDIGRMVDEFITFARMPSPIFKRENIGALLKKSVFSEQVAHPDIQYIPEFPDQTLYVQCDERQIGQVFTNLLKNAAEAIESHSLPEGVITIQVFERDRQCVVEIRDNGPGFPLEKMQKLLEPYVTTRARGTGLGLAIVKKTMDDHKAGLFLENNPQGGACVRLIFTIDVEFSENS